MKANAEKSSFGMLSQTLRAFSLLDDLALIDSPLHRIHPAMHLACTIFFVLMVASFGRYDLVRLVPFILYPAVLFSASRIPARPIMKRAAIALPFVLGIGLANLFTDQTTVAIGRWMIRGGWASLATLILKTILTVLAALLLVALTGIVKLSHALRLFRVPRLLVLQFAMTYRYMAVLSDEAMLMSLAYKLRSGGRKGIQSRDWGAVGGSLLLRTFDRARHISQAMKLLGFNGDDHPGGINPPGTRDWTYLTAWILFFLLTRLFDIPALLGSLWGGFR
jgi:cobalt/nickel transport system permease protein